MARKKCICRNEECKGKVLDVYINMKDGTTSYTDYCEYHIKKDMQKGIEITVNIPMQVWGESTLRKLGLNENGEIYITDIKGSIN